MLKSADTAVDQPVSNRRLLAPPMPSVVPPTEIANGSDEGASVPEPSPDEKYMPTPSAAARTMNECSMFVRSAGWASSPLSHELEAIDASGWPPLPSTARSALKRPWRPKSPKSQLSPPTTTWCAAGAMSYEDSTSSCSSTSNGSPQAEPCPIASSE